MVTVHELKSLRIYIEKVQIVVTFQYEQGVKRVVHHIKSLLVIYKLIRYFIISKFFVFQSEKFPVLHCLLQKVNVSFSLHAVMFVIIVLLSYQSIFQCAEYQEFVFIVLILLEIFIQTFHLCLLQPNILKYFKNFNLSLNLDKPSQQGIQINISENLSFHPCFEINFDLLDPLMLPRCKSMNAFKNSLQLKVFKLDLYQF